MPVAHIHVCPSCNREWEHDANPCWLRRTATCQECLEAPADELPVPFHDDEDDGRDYGRRYEP